MDSCRAMRLIGCTRARRLRCKGQGGHDQQQTTKFGQHVNSPQLLKRMPIASQDVELDARRANEQGVERETFDQSGGNDHGRLNRTGNLGLAGHALKRRTG
jgi:hypothetical protein